MRETPGQSQSVQTTHSPFPRKYIETAAHLSEPLDKVRYHTSCLHYLFEFHVWHLEQSPVNHTDIQFTRNWWLATSLVFLSRADALFIFFFLSSLTLPPSALILLIISNYQVDSFQFQLNLVFSRRPWGGETGGCALSPGTVMGAI